jgi:hypothetical protein
MTAGYPAGTTRGDARPNSEPAITESTPKTTKELPRGDVRRPDRSLSTLILGRPPPTLAIVLGFKIVSSAAALAAAVGLAGCSQSSVTTSDAYKIGCPAIDATMATGSVANKVAISTLREVRDHGHPSQQTKRWLKASIELLTAENPDAIPPRAKKQIIQGCKRNGYTLQNLK